MTLASGTQRALQVGLCSVQAAADIVTNINTPSPSSMTISGDLVASGASATSLVVGPNGTTNPSFVVDDSTTSAATGLKVKSAAAASGLALTTITSGTNESMTIDAAGSGAIKLNSLAGTGAVQVGGAASGVNATGLTITPNSAASGLAVAVVSTGTDEKLTVDAKGAGVITIGTTSTGQVAIARGAAKQAVMGGAKATLNTGTSVTATAAQLLGGYIVVSGQTAATTVTVDSGANLDTGVTGAATGDTIRCTLYNANTSSGAITLQAGSGNTLTGTSALPISKAAILLLQKTGGGAWDIVSIVSA